MRILCLLSNVNRMYGYTNIPLGPYEIVHSPAVLCEKVKCFFNSSSYATQMLVIEKK